MAKLLPAIFCVTATVLMMGPCSAADTSYWQDLITSAEHFRLMPDYQNAEMKVRDAGKESERLTAVEKYLSWDELARIYEEQGRYADAAAAYKKMIELSPGDQEIFTLLADVLDNQHRSDEARELRRAHLSSTAERRKLVDYLMNESIGPAMHKNLSFWSGSLLSGFAVIRFGLSPSNCKPTVFTSYSSGNAEVDKAALKAMTTSCIRLPAQMNYLVSDDFGFDYNTQFGLVRWQSAEPSRLQAKYAVLKRRLDWQQKALGLDHIEVARTLSKAANVLLDMGKPHDAEKAYRRAVKIWNGTDLATSSSYATFNDFGKLLMKQARYHDAEPIVKRAQAISKVVYAPNSEEQLSSKDKLVTVLKKLRRTKELQTLN